MVRRTTIGVMELNFHLSNFCKGNGNDSPKKKKKNTMYQTMLIYW